MRRERWAGGGTRLSPPLSCVPRAAAVECETCRRALSGSDPDLHAIHRSGATLERGDCAAWYLLAQRRPLQGDAPGGDRDKTSHLGARAAPALLKTLEEPPGDTVFVLLADDVPPELATVASRCVQIAFPPVPRASMLAVAERTGG